ncbi:MAG: ATP-binding protein [Anaerolineae bacterium]
MQSIEGYQLSRLLSTWLLLFGLLIVLLFFLRTPAGLASKAEIIVRGVLGIIIFIAYFLNRKGHYKAACNLAVVSSSLVLILLAVTEGGREGMQILNYLTVILLFASLFLPPRTIFVIFVGHVAGILLFNYLVDEIAFLDVVNGPISFNLTLAVILFFITQQRNQLEMVRQRQTKQERDVFHVLAQATADVPDGRALGRSVLSYLLKELEFDVGIVAYSGRKKEQTVVVTAVTTNQEASPQPLFPVDNEQPDPFLFISQSTIFAPDVPGVMRLAGATPKELVREHESFYETIAQMLAAALEHKHAEKAVRVSEERFRRLAYSLPDIICIINQPPAEITFINKEKLFGYSPGMFNDLESLFSVVHPDDVDQVRHFWQQLLQSSTTEGEIEYRVQKESGEWEWIESRVTTLASKVEEAPQQFLLLMTLVTERKQVVAAQKIESLGVLAGGVAHDFNNLLVAILGQTSLALRKLPPDDSVRPHIEKAVTAAERASTLTQQLLAYSGQGHFQIRPIHLNELVEENLRLLYVAVPKHVQLRSQLSPHLPYVEADIGQMQQVIMNLILNAAEAMDEKEGIVTIVTDTQVVGSDDDQFWRHSGKPLEPGLYVSLVIHDNGKGMDSKTLARIFEPFFTTKSTGRGLGLAAVLGIIRGHQGGLSVTSEVGKGSTFKLLFPAATETSHPADREEVVEDTGVFAGKVLVIDDEQPVREAVEDILALEGIAVLSAANGDEGVALYRQREAESCVECG